MNKNSIEYYKALLGPVLGTILLSFILKKHWICLISFGVGFIGLAFPSLGIYLIRFLEKIKTIIGKTINAILLGIVFYLLLTPLATLQKIFSKQKPINPRSYFIDRNKTFEPSDFEKPW